TATPTPVPFQPFEYAISALMAVTTWSSVPFTPRFGEIYATFPWDARLERFAPFTLSSSALTSGSSAFLFTSSPNRSASVGGWWNCTITSTEASAFTLFKSGEIFRAAAAALASADSWPPNPGFWLPSPNCETGFKPLAPFNVPLPGNCACAESTAFLLAALDLLKGLSLEARLRASARKDSRFGAAWLGFAEES